MKLAKKEAHLAQVLHNVITTSVNYLNELFYKFLLTKDNNRNYDYVWDRENLKYVPDNVITIELLSFSLAWTKLLYNKVTFLYVCLSVCTNISLEIPHVINFNWFINVTTMVNLGSLHKNVPQIGVKL